MDGRSAGEIAKLSMPAGSVTANYAGSDSREPSKQGVLGIGTMSVDDGTGKLTAVSASVQQNVPRAFKVTDCVTEQINKHVSGCQAVAESDGSVVLSYRMDQYYPGDDGPTEGCYSYEAVRVFQDGTVVSSSASNFFEPVNESHGKGWTVNPSRKDPLLSMDQVVAIVMDPRWGLVVSADFAQQARRDLVPYKDQTNS